MHNSCSIITVLRRSMFYTDLLSMKQIANSVEKTAKIRVQTFGNFEVFAGEKPLIFSRSKTKELLAYLVSRQGALCNNNEIIAVIWDNREDSPSIKSMFRTLVADLTHTLNAAGAFGVLIKHRGHIGIAKDKVSCDLYDLLTGTNTNSYMGEYMTQYSWAETTNNYLKSLF